MYCGKLPSQLKQPRLPKALTCELTCDVVGQLVRCGSVTMRDVNGYIAVDVVFKIPRHGRSADLGFTTMYTEMADTPPNDHSLQCAAYTLAEHLTATCHDIDTNQYAAAIFELLCDSPVGAWITPSRLFTGKQVNRLAYTKWEDTGELPVYVP